MNNNKSNKPFINHIEYYVQYKSTLNGRWYSSPLFLTKQEALDYELNKKSIGYKETEIHEYRY